MGAAEKTRQMLAQALKELMKTSPLEKISVGDFTQQAGVGRNTFYYHFKDKYDLVNWIFETESAQLLDSSAPADNWGDFLGQLDSYIRQNFSCYKNALDYSGQNSLQDYIFDVLEKRLTQRIGQMNEEMNLRMRPDEIAFTAGFFASALAIATLCCSPPESCAGKLFILSVSPTFSSISVAGIKSCTVCVDSSIFSFAVRFGIRL